MYGDNHNSSMRNDGSPAHASDKSGPGLSPPTPSLEGIGVPHPYPHTDSDTRKDGMRKPIDHNSGGSNA